MAEIILLTVLDMDVLKEGEKEFDFTNAAL